LAQTLKLIHKTDCASTLKLNNNTKSSECCEREAKMAVMIIKWQGNEKTIPIYQTYETKSVKSGGQKEMKPV
jgi:hypothetical protein